MIIRSGRLLVDQSSILADTVGNTNGARQGIDIAVTEDMTYTRGDSLQRGALVQETRGMSRLRLGACTWMVR